LPDLTALNLFSPNAVQEYRFSAGISSFFPQSGSRFEMSSAQDGSAGVRGSGFQDLLRQQLDDARRAADVLRQNPPNNAPNDVSKDAAPPPDAEKAAGEHDVQLSALHDDEEAGGEAADTAATALAQFNTGTAPKAQSGGVGEGSAGELTGSDALPAGLLRLSETAAGEEGADAIGSSEAARSESGDDVLFMSDTLPLFDNKGAVRTATEAFTGEAVEGGSGGLEIARAPNQKTSGAEGEGAGAANAGAKTALKAGAVESPEVAERGLSSAVFASFPMTEKDGLKKNAAQGGSPDAVDAASKKKTVSKKAVSVADMRTAAAGGTAVTDSSSRLFSGQAARQEAVKDMVVELRVSGWGDGTGAAQTGRESAALERLTNADLKSAAQFESFLSRELHNNLNGDIVREASVMLRDGGKGLIRLKLYPEALGNVQVRLSLSGNSVQGVITVESPEALSAFEHERAALETAFRESGFEGASLNMQMSGGGHEDRFDGRAAGAFSRSIAASEYEARSAAPRVESIRGYEQLSIFA
jgi:flagellar hook-length control protein FliK